MTRELEYLDDALVEAEEAVRWYAQRSPTAATGFAFELEAVRSLREMEDDENRYPGIARPSAFSDQAAAQAITETPNTWPAYDHGTRRFLLRRYPYSLIYRVEPTRLVIVAVAHAHRRPGYWKQR